MERVTSRLSLLSILLTVGAAGCPVPAPPSQPSGADALEKPGTPAEKKKSRPPFPNMAGPAWGEKTIRALAEKASPAWVEKGHRAALEEALRRLHSLETGAEEEVARLCAAAFRSANNDSERGSAVSIAGAALVLAPGAEDYQERLTDAYGLAGYAGTLPEGTPASQMARALIAIAAGKTREGRTLVEVLSTGRPLGAHASLLAAQARFLLGERSDKVLDHLYATLKERPESERARSVSAQLFLDLGWSKRAARVLRASPVVPRAPILDVYLGRALILDGQPKEGLQLLRDANEKLSEARRGTALYLLARSLGTRADGKAEAASIVDTLKLRPGFAGETQLLSALLDLHAGRFESARKTSSRLARIRGVPGSIALEALWTWVDACAALGDAPCVKDQGEKAVQLSGNRARFAHARAALALIGGLPRHEGTGPSPDAWTHIDIDTALTRAHLLSPADPQLAKRLKLEAVPGGRQTAEALRAARRSLLTGARTLAAEELQPMVKEEANCRVCRALFALASANPNVRAQRAVDALNGKGPPLHLSDLLSLINALGASALPAGKKRLEALRRDPRPEVIRAATQALEDIAHPEQRKARLQKKHEPHPGTVPTPGLAPPQDQANP